MSYEIQLVNARGIHNNIQTIAVTKFYSQILFPNAPNYSPLCPSIELIRSNIKVYGEVSW